MAVREGIARRRRMLTRRRTKHVVPTFVQHKLRELEPGSPEYLDRERLLKIMRDKKRSQSERTQAAIEALPLCYVEPDPITTVTHTFIKAKKTRKR